MVIHGPTNAAYDIDLGPVLLNDWYHGDYRSLVEEIMSPADSPVILTSDSNMINGKTNYPCSSDLGDECTENAGISKFRFQTGKTHRLRLINGGGDGYQQFSIDGHEMTVIANDFVTVNPYTTNVVTLGVGQRTDVLVKATMNPTSAVYMRSNITCVQASNPAAVAIIYYDKASNETIPESNPQSYTEGCSNDDLSTTVPTYPIPVPDPDLTVTVSITFGQNATGSWLWSMNNTSARTDYNAPTLLLAKQGNTSFEPDWNVYSTQRSKSYRFIVNNNSSTPHPLHYHGHNMYILATGTGTWDGSSITNPSNPQRRDVQIIPANGYLVWQADAINPGLWAFHCHIVWHLSAGFAMQVLENLDAIETLPVPSTAYQVCRDWAAWSGTNLVDQIDSGL
ncbi:putative multicopper like protein [Phaeomoniella chlamydospora]|uniref:Putative multicopper like protein n=1 Tax=Phaeomoniella chlamydospora TaxID=158046 RepID=A0A0G2EGA4_PHACM|nr:putative multicopper like protein [Phaeomoniella chlamydospora]